MVKRPALPESGVALVITLILLAVITFMAVTFLVISTSERKAVASQTDQTVAKLAAEAGTERALAECLAGIMATSNQFSYPLQVSTNYINTNFYTAGAAYTSPTNVNFDLATGNAALQNLANLLYNPRVPVITSNPVTGRSEFRFYLDLNQNGMFEPTGIFPETNALGQQILGANNLPKLTYFAGDPQWIGVLERPGFPHSSSNYFVSRYAYLVAPAGQTLDLNYIHNAATRTVPSPTSASMALGADDGYRRDQGVGTYEINLAAFLADLNTNLWNTNISPYLYSPLTDPTRVAGTAYEDALGLLAYRYNGTLGTLKSMNAAFPASVGPAIFRGDYVDEYMFGNLMTNLWWRFNASAGVGDADPAAYPWTGSENTNHYFTTQDLFDKSKTQTLLGPGVSGFTDRLLAAGACTDSYDRYTFYRLLQQMGMESASEPAGRMNLNYDNLVQYSNNVAPSATNFIPWRPVDFFVNAANRLLTNAGYTFPPLVAISDNATAFNFASQGIEVWPTNCYTPSVHRLLQLAANIYDATTNRRDGVISGTMTNGLGFPSVFRPIFGNMRANGSNTIYIVGYQELTNADFVGWVNGVWNTNNAPLSRDITVAATRSGWTAADYIYGFPLVIGAKKGWPNFNEYGMQSMIQVTRKLQFVRNTNSSPNPTTGAFPIGHTNQMYLLGISNVIGVEGWNSYSNKFQRPLTLMVAVDQITTVSNQAGVLLGPNSILLSSNAGFSVITNIGEFTWPGFSNVNDASFQVPFLTNYWFLSNSECQFRVPSQPKQMQLVAPSGVFEDFGSTSQFPVPHWWVALRNRLRFILVDTGVTPNRIVDYANLDSVEDPIDIATTLMGGDNAVFFSAGDTSDNGEWNTNRMVVGSTSLRVQPIGVEAQIEACLGWLTPLHWDSFIKQSPAGNDVPNSIGYFLFQFGLGPSDGTYGISNTFYAPFSPFRYIYFHTGWHANDPLVHYTVGDLLDGTVTNKLDLDTLNTTADTITNLGRMNRRYEPWGGGGNPVDEPGATKYDLTVKDPLITRSDDWEFPTNKFPSVGWLGRVHRGTPWQTVDLKSAVPTNVVNWAMWTGNLPWTTNIGQISTNILPLWPGNTNNTLAFSTNDAVFSLPGSDRGILDLFTTALNDDMTRGRLSVNQTNLAAWSGILGGVSVLTNLSATVYSNIFVTPAGVYNAGATSLPPIVKIVNGINNMRATLTNQNFAFQRVGDILAVPELTLASQLPLASPYLNIPDINSMPGDAVLERIPQQILGLLQCDPPRVVIYSWGQALKPAEHSLVTSGGFFGLCTNYQVMSETATRTVVRIEGAPNNPRAVIESFNVLPPD